jgi:hypothetical protein
VKSLSCPIMVERETPDFDGLAKYSSPLSKFCTLIGYFC